MSGSRSIPQLLLTTTGGKSGEARTVALLYGEYDGGYIVVASNWGKITTRRGRRTCWRRRRRPWSCTEQFLAALAAGAEREAVWPTMTKIWPAYDTYVARSGRDVRVLLLRPR